MNLFSALIVSSIFLSLCACSSIKKEAAERVFTIDRKWARYTPIDLYLGASLNHRMQPLLFGEYVIQGNSIDGIRAYRKNTGAPVWQRHFSGGVEIGAALSGSNLLFGAGDGFFYSLDAYTGTTRWSFPIKSEGLGEPTVQGDVVYFVAGNGTTYAVNINSGEQIWFYSRVASRPMTIRGSSQPTIVGQSLILGFSDGNLVALNKDTGSMMWERPLGSDERFSDIDAKPVLFKGQLYISAYDGKLYSLDPQTGKVNWSVDHGGFTAPEIHENKIYVSSSTGEVLCLELSTGKKLWSYKVSGQGVATAPVYYRGLILFGEWRGNMVALDALSGEVVDSYSTGVGITSAPTIDIDTATLYVMTADANLFVFGLNWKKQWERWEWQRSPYL